MIIECTNAALYPGNPGVVRTARLLGRELERHKCLLPIWYSGTQEFRAYRLLRPDERGRLASHGGPRDVHFGLWAQSLAGDEAALDLPAALDRLQPTVLFLLEAPMDEQVPERLLWAYSRKLKVAAILDNVIPLTHPVLCVPSIVRQFSEYAEGISGTDALFAISAESLRQFERHAARHGLPLPGIWEVVWLPAQFSTWPRNTQPDPVASGTEPIRCLCVGSIEPRKNHENLISAFQSLVRRRADLDIALTLVGNRFAGAEAIAERIEQLTHELPSLRWTGIVSDEVLADLYRRSSFTVYPSLVEGFGLPIMESLWMGRPCLCHLGGVMGELAAGGGCLTVDMSDGGAIEAALESLATRPDLRQRLTDEAQSRELKNWASYGAELVSLLKWLAPRAFCAPAGCS